MVKNVLIVGNLEDSQPKWTKCSRLGWPCYSPHLWFEVSQASVPRFAASTFSLVATTKLAA